MQASTFRQVSLKSEEEDGLNHFQKTASSALSQFLLSLWHQFYLHELQSRAQFSSSYARCRNLILTRHVTYFLTYSWTHKLAVALCAFTNSSSHIKSCCQAIIKRNRSLMRNSKVITAITTLHCFASDATRCRYIQLSVKLVTINPQKFHIVDHLQHSQYSFFNITLRMFSYQLWLAKKYSSG